MTTVRVPASVTTLTTAADALHGEEVERTRSVVKIAWIVAACVGLASYALPGDHRIRTALVATLGVGVVGSIWVFRELRDSARYQARMMHVLAFAAVVCGQLGILY